MGTYHAVTFTDAVFKTPIFKGDVSYQTSAKQANEIENIVIYKRIFDTESVDFLKQKLYKTSVDVINFTKPRTSL